MNKIDYRDIISLENLKEGLKKTKNNYVPGVDGEIKGNFNDKKLGILHKELKSQNFKPSPLRKINISKPDGKTRLLGAASQRDKIVQAAILIQLEKVLENVFLDCSYGGRPNRNCHHALKNIKSKWHNVTWIINIDIQKHFDSINHDLLLTMLKEYCDQATVELIRKLFNCGYIDLHKHPETFEPLESDTPKGSHISPILSNLYLHHLDKFLFTQLFPKWNINPGRTHTYATQTHELTSTEGKKQVKTLNTNDFKAKNLKNNNERRINYVRYIDDFIFGFAGSKAEALEIKSLIKAFLYDELKLKTNDNKSYIKHSSDKGIKYLGYYIRYIFNNKIIKDHKYNEDKSLQLKYTLLNKAQFRIPVELILRKAVYVGYGKIRKDGSIRPSSCRKLCSLEDKLIVTKFSSIIKSLMDFYSPVNKRSDLWQIVAFYRKSCALTLADKHKLKTAAATYKKYGPNLKISDPIKKKETVLFYPTTLKTTGNFRLSKSQITISIL